MSYDINLHFPHVDWTVQMPAVPRKGDKVEFADPNIGDTSWNVTEVAYTAYTDGTEGSINLALNPADEDTKRRSDQFEADRLAALRSARVVDTPGEATGGSARIVTTKKDDAGSITISDPDSGQTVEIAPWTSEETERYDQTGETPLARLHRENLARQWNSGDDEK